MYGVLIGKGGGSSSEPSVDSGGAPVFDEYVGADKEDSAAAGSERFVVLSWWQIAHWSRGSDQYFPRFALVFDLESECAEWPKAVRTG